MSGKRDRNDDARSNKPKDIQPRDQAQFGKADFWGKAINWSRVNPVQLLDDARFVVRRRAQQEAAKRNMVNELKSVVTDRSSAEFKRMQAVWALCLCESAEARTATRLALADQSPKVRQIAAHAVSVWKDSKAMQELCRLLRLSPASNRRVAAEALGRIRDPRAVAALLDSASSLKIIDHRIADRGWNIL